MAWLFVPGAADSNSPYISSSKTTGPFVLSKGKPTPQPPTWIGWKKRAWVHALSGMTSRPLTLSRGVNVWISSLLATRVSPFLSPALALEKMTRDISGLTSSGLCGQLCPPSSGLKTLHPTLPGVSIPSKETWKALATRLRRESTARQKSARRIFESGCLSSGSWSTPTVAGTAAMRTTKYNQGGTPITAQVLAESWPTPNTVDSKGGKHHGKGQVQLCHIASQSWPTPRATDGPKGGPNQRGSKGDLMLPAAVQDWATPTAATATGGQKSRGGSRKGELLLAGQAARWGTPTARDWKSGRGRDGQLTDHLQRTRGPLAEEPSNTPGKSPGLLNPAWVEQLMGWIPGQSSFSCSETAWSLWLAQWRLWLFGRN